MKFGVQRTLRQVPILNVANVNTLNIKLRAIKMVKNLCHDTDLGGSALVFWAKVQAILLTPKKEDARGTSLVVCAGCREMHTVAC